MTAAHDIAADGADIQEVMHGIGASAKSAAHELASATPDAKNAALHAAAAAIRARKDEVLAANASDVARAEAKGVKGSFLDRLVLNDDRVEAMARGLEEVAALPDPIGTVLAEWDRPNGLKIARVRVPLGVIGVIYESRPNVTSDAFGLCLKSGNVAFLRGSSSAINSILAIAAVLRGALPTAGLPADALVVVDDTRREAAIEFMQQRGFVDCLIPRGGPSLIQSILDNATVPYVIDGAGNCHVYVDASADLAMAVDITVNAKTQRIGVCNAAESLVVHHAIAAEFLPMAARALSEVELVGDERARAFVAMGEATDEDFATEYLAMKMSVKVVDDLDAAIAHVNETSTGHSEAIITNDIGAADRFAREVDAAAVLINASTRFVDGEEFGFGAEIGISTQKLHARGPMGLEQLTTEKFVVRGTGQVRR